MDDHWSVTLRRDLFAEIEREAVRKRDSRPYWLRVFRAIFTAPSDGRRMAERRKKAMDLLNASAGLRRDK